MNWPSSSPVSPTSAALAALVHAGLVGLIAFLPAGTGGKARPAPDVIPITLVDGSLEKEPEPVLPEPLAETVPDPAQQAEDARTEETVAKQATATESLPAARKLEPDMPPAAQTEKPDEAAPPDTGENGEPDLTKPVARESPSAGGIADIAPTDAAETAATDAIQALTAPSTAPASLAAEPGDASQQAGLSRYLGDVRLQLARHSPKGVSGAGDCEVTFQLSRSGTLLSSSVSKASGSPRYDRRCLKAVKRAAPFPEAPRSADEADLVFSITMRQK